MVVSVNAASGAIALPAEDYLIVRDGSAFRAWFARHLRLGELVFADQTIGDGGRCTIRLVTRPDLAAWVPASVRKHVTSAAEIEFVDELTYERSALEAPPYRIHVRTSSPFLGERLRIEATMTIAPVDEWHAQLPRDDFMPHVWVWLARGTDGSGLDRLDLQKAG